MSIVGVEYTLCDQYGFITLFEQNNGEKLIAINKDNFYETYHAKMKEIGCRDLPPYSCRHTTATALAIGKEISPLNYTEDYASFKI